MPQYTPNLQLYKWDKTDSKVDTITEMASNAHKIDTKLKDVDESIAQINTDLSNTTSTANDAVQKIEQVQIESAQAVTDSSEAKGIAESANTKSDEAKTLATDAKNTANTVKTQFDEVTKASSIDPQVSQALVGSDGKTYANIANRFDAVDALMAQKAEQTDLLVNTKKLSYKEKQAILHALFYKKLRMGQAVKIVCEGDSTTYGFDNVSTDKRPPFSDPTLDPGLSYVSETQASVTYPEKLKALMDLTYGAGKVTILNRGKSGDSAEQGYNRWATTANADMTIISYGINDSRSSAVSYKGDILQFLYWYRLLIERELDRGSAVIILSPFKFAHDEIITDTYRNALIALGSEYQIPVIDMDEMLSNYGKDIYSDTIHYNGTGYTVIAAKVSALLVGEGANKPKKVFGGTELLTRDYNDNCFMLNGTRYHMDAGYPTPNELDATKGFGYFLGTNSARITYSFYSEEDNLLVIPDLYTLNAGARVKVEVDYGINIAKPSNVMNIGQYTPSTYLTPSGIFNESHAVIPGKTAYKNRFFGKSEFMFNKLIVPKILITSKGWHTISIYPDTTAPVAGTTVLGLTFMSLDVFRQEKSISIPTHANHTDTTVVNSIKVKKSDLIQLLEFDRGYTGVYWNNSPLKISVYNWNFSIIDYYLELGGSYLISQGNRKQINADTSYDRTITSVTYDSATDMLTINFGGKLDRATLITFTY